MANTFLGVAINFGVASTTLSFTGIGTFKLQSRDHKKGAQMDAVQDADGITVQKTFYDPFEEADFSYVMATASIAGTVTNSTLPAIGAIGSVVDTLAYTAIAGTNWIVEDASTKGTNTKALVASIKLKRYTGTGAISAVTT